MEEFNGGIGVLLIILIPTVWIIYRDISDTRKNYLKQSPEGKKMLEERWGQSGEKHHHMSLIILACVSFLTIFLLFKWLGY